MHFVEIILKEKNKKNIGLWVPINENTNVRNCIVKLEKSIQMISVCKLKT